MKFEEIKELMKQFEESEIHKFEFKNGDFKLKLEKETIAHGIIQQVQPIHAAPIQMSNTIETNAPTASAEIEGNVVKAPLVGTYYSSPSPDKDAYVKIGDKVAKGQTICIIEAMKVMNEITATHDGIVSNILVSDREMVEFGQPLVVIK